MIVKILDRVYVGDSKYTDSDLKSLGINYVVNVGGDRTDLEDVWIHLTDDGGNDYNKILEAIGILRLKVFYGNRVLVHCRAGISRSPYLVAKYLTDCGFSLFEAIDFIKSRHPATQINIDLLNTEAQGK